MKDLVKEVEDRGQAAWKTLEGPDYKQIVTDVAKENGLDYETLRGQCLDRWTNGGTG
jgi:hypothetical protein